MSGPTVRKGQAPPKLTRDEFVQRFTRRFTDPAFRTEDAAIARLSEIAWQAYSEGRKSPITREAGPEFHDPSYQLSLDWLDARARLRRAHERWADRTTPSRVLIVVSAGRNDGTCPSERSKTHRLAEIAREVLCESCETDLLDLSLLASEHDRHIHPCKACVSTAMPLCHWPCSCYPNHSLGQVNDWMNEIYERWTLAHGVLILTPVYWYQATSGLKLMIDRLVCADGGNPDPTTTAGKDPERATNIELRGWHYPKHLAGRAYGVVVHGDVSGIEAVRRALSDWLDWMGLIDSGASARIDRFVGYYEPYATSHEALDRDTAFQEEVRVAARSVAEMIERVRDGHHREGDAGQPRVRPK